jgi:hypothetical protein
MRDTENLLSPNVLNLPLSKPLGSLPAICSLTRVTCADERFDFIRSEDLTFDNLRLEVARLMYCSPSQLVVVASEVDYEMDMQYVVFDLASIGSYTNHIHYEIVCEAGSEDREMEDAEY